MGTCHSSIRKSTISPFLDGTENSKNIYIYIYVALAVIQSYDTNLTTIGLQKKRTNSFAPAWVQPRQIHVFLIVYNLKINIRINSAWTGSISFKDFMIIVEQSYSLILWPVRKDIADNKMRPKVALNKSSKADPEAAMSTPGK